MSYFDTYRRSSSVRRLSVCQSIFHLSTPLNDFSSEIPRPIFLKLHVEPSVKGGLNICTIGLGPVLGLSWMRVQLETRRSRVRPLPGQQHSFMESDHEIFSTVILSLPLIQEGQLSVSGERMCTILVNRLED